MTAVDRVKIIHGGEPQGGRVLSISGAVASVETPARAPTTTEINAKIRTHFDEPWDNLVFEAVNRFNDIDQVVALHRKNGAFSKKRRALTAQVDKFRGYALTKYAPQFPLDARLEDRDIRILVDLQVESGVDVITIPEPQAGCSIERFRKNLNFYWDYVTKAAPGASVMPYIGLNQDNADFERKLNEIGQHEHDLWCIGIRFASPQEYRPNLLSVAEFASRDFWVHCSLGRRFPNWHQPLGQLHALQRFGIDTVAIEVPQAPIKGDWKIQNIRYFDGRTITYPSLGEIGAERGGLPCKCPVCTGRDVQGLIENVRPWGPEDELVLRVNDCSKVHEVYASSLEFERTREVIKEGELTKYFRSKSGLRPFLDSSNGVERLF